MARKQPNKSRKQKALQDRYNSMSPQEFAERWNNMRPRYFKWLGLFACITPSIWLVNHALVLRHTAEELKNDAFYSKLIGGLNVGFQISTIFCVLFVMLIGMSYFYGRAPRAAA